jgi:hypothetical protein
VSSIKPNGCGGEVYGGEEVSGGLVVARCDGAELLEFGEEVLNEVARLVDVVVVFAGQAAICLWRDHNVFAGRDERHDDPLVGVEGLVSNQRVGLHRGQQVVGADEIMRLSAGQEEVDRVTECVGQDVDFGAQSTARSPNRLVLADFFSAPALC